MYPDNSGSGLHLYHYWKHQFGDSSFPFKKQEIDFKLNRHIYTSTLHFVSFQIITGFKLKIKWIQLENTETEALHFLKFDYNLN